jgi:hypothetical protein
MKKAPSVVLIFLALAYVTGIMPLYFYLKEDIKGSMANELHSESNLQKVTVTNAEYNDPSVFQKTGDDEFSFRGQMYDFKSVEKCKGGYIFYGLSDNKETSLIGLVKNIFGQTDNAKNHSIPLNNFLKIFFADFIIPGEKDFMASLLVVNSFSVVNLNTCILNGHRASIHVPPDFS